MSERKALIVFTIAMAANVGLALCWICFGDRMRLPF